MKTDGSFAALVRRLVTPSKQKLVVTDQDPRVAAHSLSHTLCLNSNKPWFSSQNINDEQLIKDDKQVQAINCLDLSLANIQMLEAWINIFSILPTQSILLIGARTLLTQDIVYCIWLRIEKYLLVQVGKVFVHTIKPEREFLNQCKCNSQCH